MTSILCIETATHNCSVALTTPDDIICERSHRGEGYVHAEMLHVFIDELLRESGIRPNAIAVSSGPGSYTGLRIGVSAAKGLAFGFNVPLIGIPTLEHFAYEQTLKFAGRTHFVPLLDARRMEVYCNAYAADGSSAGTAKAHVLTPSSFADLTERGTVLFFGDASLKASEVIAHPNAEFVHGLWPSAEGMRHLVHERYAREEFEDLAGFEPFYLKDFIAGQPRKLL